MIWKLDRLGRSIQGLIELVGGVGSDLFGTVVHPIGGSHGHDPACIHPVNRLPLPAGSAATWLRYHQRHGKRGVCLSMTPLARSLLLFAATDVNVDAADYEPAVPVYDATGLGG